MKFCYICNKHKASNDFHVNNRSKDGLQSRCKSCKHNYQMSRKHLTRVYDAKYRRDNKEHLDKIRLEYRKTSKYKESHKRGVANYRKNNPEIYKAYKLVQVAKKNGTLIVKPCKSCGSEKNVHAHHHDYSKPLDVEWMCASCHGKEHRTV